MLPGIIGTLQANEVLKLVLGIGKSLSGKLYCFNALTNQANTLRMSRVDSEIKKVKARGMKFEVLDSSFYCTDAEIEIDRNASVSNNNGAQPRSMNMSAQNSRGLQLM